nr:MULTISPECIES: GFA family protein [unclassified Caulobacter]
MCHCLDCQRRTGSILSIAAFYERAAVTLVQGLPRQFTRDSASGKPVTFHFCGTCGANVFWEPARMPHLVGVAVGAFGDPDFPRPEQAVWTKDRHRWLHLPADTPSFEVNPPPR